MCLFSSFPCCPRFPGLNCADMEKARPLSTLTLPRRSAPHKNLSPGAFSSQSYLRFTLPVFDSQCGSSCGTGDPRPLHPRFSSMEEDTGQASLVGVLRPARKVLSCGRGKIILKKRSEYKPTRKVIQEQMSPWAKEHSGWVECRQANGQQVSQQVLYSPGEHGKETNGYTRTFYLASLSHQKRKSGKDWHRDTKVEGVHHFQLFLQEIKIFLKHLFTL